MVDLKKEAPVWDLSYLYEDMDDPQIEQDFQKVEKICQKIQKQKGQFASLSTADFEQLMKDYQELHLIKGRLSGYSSLLISENMADKKVTAFQKEIVTRNGAVSEELAFFSNEVIAIPEARLKQHIAHSSFLGKISRYFDELKENAQFMLSDEEEADLIKQYTDVEHPMQQRYQQVLATASGKIDGKSYSLTELAAKMQSTDEAVRKKAYLASLDVYEDHKEEMAKIHSDLAALKYAKDQKRGYKTADESRNRANGMSDKALAALVSAYDEMAPDLSHKYYQMRADILGVKKVKPWDMSAPLSDDKESIRASWAEAQSGVIQAWEKFSPEQAKWVRAFFDENRVHARKTAGKRGGAFAHPITSKEKPFLFMNFEGLKTDAKTLAHEMGHGIHFTSYARHQEELVAHPPLAVMEIPSFFGEMIYLDHLKETTNDPEQLRDLLMDAVAQRLNSVGGQLNFHKMELGIHNHVRQNGHITAADILKISEQGNKEYFGDAVEEAPKDNHRWMRIHHLIKAPFYVYAYAVDACLSMTLYDQYKQACANGKKQDFMQKWQDFLDAGDTKSLTDMMSDFGLDLEDPKVWKRGLTLLSDMIKDVETLNETLAKKATPSQSSKRRGKPLTP